MVLQALKTKPLISDHRTTEPKLSVPEQQQSSLHPPSYWWQEKTRCYQWSGSAPAARHTLSAMLRISVAPGLLWDVHVNINQNTFTDRQILVVVTLLLVGVLLLEPSSPMPEAELY